MQRSGRPPSAEIARLHRLVELLDARKNQFFAVLAPFLLWTTQFALAIQKWRVELGPAIGPWFDALFELEALCDLGGYAYEHPGDPFPQIETAARGPLFDGRGLGHPLIAEDCTVRNDLQLDAAGCALHVVSGSNMSGKSTWLRTIGSNAVLALAGAPVRASSLRVSRFTVGASIRVQDSLKEGASRFYAEIRGLARVVERASEGPVLFLLDEILAGTNSHDRGIGAAALVRAFLERGAIGLLTTHDLALARIADELAPRAANVHFEDQIEDGAIRFDHRMRPGVVTRSNALALMRAVGLKI
jgi:DNA mismatch repair ATPase MutS